MLSSCPSVEFTVPDTCLNAVKWPEVLIILGMYFSCAWFVVESVGVLVNTSIPDLNYFFFHVFHFGLYLVLLKVCVRRTQRKFFLELVRSNPVLILKGLFIVCCFSISDTLANPPLPLYHFTALAVGNFSNILILYLSLFELDVYYGIAFFGYAFANGLFFVTTQFQVDLGLAATYYADQGGFAKIRIGLSCTAFSMLCLDLFLHMNTYTRRKFWVGGDRGLVALKKRVKPADPGAVALLE